MSKENVLLITESFYPDGWGGMHIYVYNQAKYFKASASFNPYVLTIKTKPGQPDEEEILGIKVFRIQTAVAGVFRIITRPFLSILNAMRRFKKLSKETNFKVLHQSLVIEASAIPFEQAEFR